MNKIPKTTIRFHGFSLCFTALAILVGCNSAEQSPSGSVISPRLPPLTTLTAKQKVQKKLAIEAKDKLVRSLLGELTNSMSEKGPAKSIAVCKTRAPEIADATSEKTGVRIGRTSFQLRNKRNQAPDWAADFVSARVEKPVEVALPNDGLGVLLPIRLQATCTLCHGDDKQIMPEVKAAIVSNYPNDKATGFAEGDIRGYFWVEVPATANQTTD